MSASEPSIAPYTVAAIQFDPALGEKDKNISDLLRLTEEAARHGARLIVHPELATTGYCWLSREEVAPYVEPVPGPTTDRFQQLAAQYDCYIATSFPEVDPATNVYYNCMVLLSPTGLIGVYRKIHSYISEPRWARDGDLGFPVWDTPLGRLAGIICMDAEFFEAARMNAACSSAGEAACSTPMARFKPSLIMARALSMVKSMWPALAINAGGRSSRTAAVSRALCRWAIA